MRILLTGTRAPATLELARRLADAGATVIGADSMRFPLGKFSRAMASHHRLPAPVDGPETFRDALATLIERERIERVWPTCEEIFHVAARAPLASSARLFCPSLAVLLQLHDKLEFARSAGDLAPPSWEAGMAPAGKRLVYKPCYSRFASRTRFGSPPRDPRGWMAQEYIEGEEFSSWAMATEGCLGVSVMYRCPARAGRGAGCAFVPHWDPDAADFIQSRVESLRFTGSIAFDFIRSSGGRLFVIECNPRLTSGIHLLDPSVDILKAMDTPGQIPSPTRAAQLFLPVLWSAPRLADRRADVIRSSGDPWPQAGQFLTILEFAGRAIRHRCALIEATTRDIEYNG